MPSGRRTTAAVLLLATLLLFSLGLDVQVPADTDTWSPGPLQGQLVNTLITEGDEILAGTGEGLYRLGADNEAVQVPGVNGPVLALSPEPDGLYLGTDDGVYAAAPPGDAPRSEGLQGLSVLDLASGNGRQYAATGRGVYVRNYPPDTSEWEPLSAAGTAAGGPANAVLPTQGAVVVGGPEGLFHVAEDSVAERTRSGPVQSLGEAGGSLWAGVRGEPGLLVSGDSGRSWESSGSGLLLEAVNTLLVEPGGSASWLAGGSGLADGTNLAGVMTSEDGGRTWSSDQNRLSNTNVLDLTALQEPSRLQVSLFSLLGPYTLDLPAQTTRFYAGTAGSGVYTYRPPPAWNGLADALRPTLYLLEPVLAGLILLLLVWRFYFSSGTK